jgi:hypothetical protein
MEALLSRAVEEQLTEQHSTSVVLAELRQQLAEIREELSALTGIAALGNARETLTAAGASFSALSALMPSRRDWALALSGAPSYASPPRQGGGRVGGSSAALDEMIDRYAPEMSVPPPTVLQQARRNLELRAALLHEFGGATAEQLAELTGSRAKNPQHTLDNWRRAHKVVAVRFNAEHYVPGFMLRPDGKPDPRIQPVLKALAEQEATPWEAAAWWVLPRWQLDGGRAVDLLLASQLQSDDADREVQAKLLDIVHEARNYF